MEIAFVYDRVNKFGGAERVLCALHEIWPCAPLYTAVYDKEKASWADVFSVKTSFLRFFPFLQSRHEVLSLITPYAFESFNFENYDVVLSVTSADAKAIVTKPHTLHICYLLTPTRYLWSGYNIYLREPGVGFLNPIARSFMKLFFTRLRHWDFTASFRPDVYIAISRHVARRIKTYYKKDSYLVYPPVETEKFLPHHERSSSCEVASSNKASSEAERSNYYLIVSRLVPYKRIDYVIKVFNKLGLKLKIIGRGVDGQRLRNLALGNIEFLGGDLTDEKLCCYYQNCKALIFPGREDFGLTAVEAQSCGKPVLAYSKGGVSESMVPGVTGELYDNVSEESFLYALKRFEKKHFSPSKCRKNAERFSKARFKREVKSMVESLWNKHKKKL